VRKCKVSTQAKYPELYESLELVASHNNMTERKMALLNIVIIIIIPVSTKNKKKRLSR
jgi:hypothetical protein